MDTADIYVDERMVAAQVGAQEAAWHSLVDGTDGGLEALQAWADGRTAVRRVRVWLGASLCRPFLLPAAAGRPAERLRIAQAMVPAQTGLPAASRVLLAAAAEGHRCPAAAVDERELGRLEALLRRLGWRAVGIRPWWAEALRAVLREEPALSAFGIHDGASFMTAFGDAEGYRHLRCLHPVVDEASADAAWRRARLADASDGPACKLTLDIGGRSSGPAPARSRREPALHVPFGEWARWEWDAA